MNFAKAVSCWGWLMVSVIAKEAANIRSGSCTNFGGLILCSLRNR